MPNGVECVFSCLSNSDKKLISGEQNRIKIISSSTQINDLYHIDLQSMLDNNPNVTLHFYNTCVTTYNSKIHYKQIPLTD